MNEHGGLDPNVMTMWSECYLATKVLPWEVCVRLARRNQRRSSWKTGGPVESIAASEIHAIAFEGVTMLHSVEEHLRPILDRLADLRVAKKMGHIN